MDIRANIGQLKNPQDIARLVSIISEISEELDVLYTETAPNGVVSARIGRVAMYKNGSTYETWQNTDGSTTWKRIDSGAYTSPFQAGDWIVSSVNTARTGWTNKSATYSNKFMRINATPLTTGGSDTHTTPSHTLTTDEIPAHNHTIPYGYPASGTGAPLAPDYSAASQTGSYSVATGNGNVSGGGHTHSAADNVPAYVQVCIFEKDT